MQKVLIANRGEIALRVIQAVREAGMRAVAVYADPDAGAPHVAAADEAYRLPGSTPAETYLNIARLLEIAEAHDVDAVHPGYGFLSENPRFAQACADADLVFIGPSPDVMATMGDKIVSKQTMEAAGVPVLKGVMLDPHDIEAWKTAAEQIGFPVLLKAAAGGGGKGMRLVEGPEGLQEALEGAAREAAKAFGDDRVFMEKYIARPRHIEVQVFADTHGNVVHMLERECSIQRRHQKVVEESPACGIDDALRARLGEAAVAAARAVGYVNAGTVEFIMDQGGQFWFMEMNTRLQVEHGVTELMLGRDLVRTQLLVAAGHALPFTQNDLRAEAHAIECRIYAEDPSNSFLPATGEVRRLRLPRGPGIRVDCGIVEGYAVTVHHDPMLAKVLTWGKTREEALQKMRVALSDLVILGVTTNTTFLRSLIAHPDFVAGNVHTHFLKENVIAEPAPRVEALVAAAFAAQSAGTATSSATSAGSAAPTHEGPWQRNDRWRMRA